MRKDLFFLLPIITVFISLNTGAQNTSPYWSLAGNSNASSTTSKLGTTNAIPLRLFTNNATRIYISSGGNVGIGTSSPSQKLFVSGNTIITGNVGIGTTNPNDKLHVVGIGLFTQGVSASNGGVIGNNTNGAGLIGEGNTFGLYARSTGGGHGVDGWSSYLGVYGNGGSYGVYGASGYIGVYGGGSNSGIYGSGTTYGAYGTSANGIGVVGNSTNYLGGYFYSANSYGIRAATGLSSKNWAGVFDGNVLAYGSYQTSDQNLKKNIEDFTDAMSIISKLKPRSYEFRREKRLASLNLPEGKHFGLIAQELEDVLPNLVKEVENDLPPELESKPQWPEAPDAERAITTPPATQQTQVTEKITIKAVNYTELIPLLIKAVQEQQQKIDQQQQQIEDLKKLVNKITQGQYTNTTISSFLGQNNPNPVINSTKIAFSIPEGAKNAQLLISDDLGRPLKTIQINNSGAVDFDASTLTSGVYHYSLIIDNKTIQTRKMTVVK
ncbi:tail fiber domain-containing protein [Chitinophagaceae bacterium LB-8]|uniref:Tail fiber domain-containing protein n=1 Tax=Paraflavisolibacter caeni TaxID=2982496 RepID=A0A9X2Y147_9BACT|nr:tail fiber domain-containing protein [Paraflavisolibacter caeni]MCU7552826.1 tail fiber domain-containing protein [Paraflavisolibacter caeni]